MPFRCYRTLREQSSLERVKEECDVLPTEHQRFPLQSYLFLMKLSSRKRDFIQRENREIHFSKIAERVLSLPSLSEYKHFVSDIDILNHWNCVLKNEVRL